jgi:hypothetical protein
MKRTILPLAVAASTMGIGCASLIGLGDVPVPNDASIGLGDDAALGDAADATQGSSTDARAGELEAGHDATAASDASQDGSAVGDTSVGEDAPEACSSDAACGESSCSKTPCQPVSLTPATQPVGIAVNESRIYWEEAAGNVQSLPVAGTATPSTFFPSTYALTCNLAINSTNAYWIENQGPTGTRYVQTLIFNGSGSWQFDTLYTGPVSFVALAVDDRYLFTGSVNGATQAGGCPGEITVQPLTNLTTGSSVSFSACNPWRLALDPSDTVYWTDLGSPIGSNHPGVLSRALAATSPTTIALAQSPYGIAIYDGKLYYGDTSAAEIFVYALGSSGSPTMFASSPDPQDIVADSSGVYWIDSATTIMKAPLGGGTPTSIASGQAQAVALATNSTGIYWVNQGTQANGYADGAVMKITK